MDGAARAGRWLALESRLEACGLVSGYVLGDGSDWEARGEEKKSKQEIAARRLYVPPPFYKWQGPERAPRWLFPPPFEVSRHGSWGVL